MSLAALFPEEDYRFHLTLRREDPRAYFAPQDAHGGRRAERARWLAEAPARYAALTPEGRPLLAEFATLGESWGLAPAQALTDVTTLGRMLEPDVLFLSADAEGEFRLRGGALCFPTGWALEEKIGEPLEAIHGAVPGLNPALGRQIAQFLSRLRPGTAFLRDNWGIAASDELNLHPSRAISAPDLPVALNRLWLRVEHQALLALPMSGGVVFGIRIALHRLDAVAHDAAARRGLRRALLSMPEELARYKRVDVIRAELAAALA